MLLVDSCVWIDWFRGHETPAVRLLREIQQNHNAEICISGIVYFEVLRGIAADLERNRVRKMFDLLEQREFRFTAFAQLTEYAVAAERRGIQVKKLGDWLIVKTVLDHSLGLLTSDKGFHRLHSIIPALVVVP